MMLSIPWVHHKLVKINDLFKESYENFEIRKDDETRLLDETEEI